MKLSNIIYWSIIMGIVIVTLIITIPKVIQENGSLYVIFFCVFLIGLMICVISGLEYSFGCGREKGLLPEEISKKMDQVMWLGLAFGLLPAFIGVIGIEFTKCL